MISAKFAGNFVSSMEDRLGKWSASPRIAFTIKVPPDLYFWYYQEYGVAPRTIVPREATMLAFPGAQGTVLMNQADWPGIQGTHTVGTVQETIPDLAREILPTIFSNGNYDPSQITEAFMTEFMTRIKAEIVELMAQTIPGTRPANPEHPKQGGKLGGRTAAEVFDENATIEPTE